MIYLNDIWSLYFHDPYDYNWDINSYKFICNISSIEDFIEVYTVFNELFMSGMFFIMREYITPRWEDDNNKHGGCFSFKLMKYQLNEKLFELFSQLLGEHIGKTEKYIMNVNGVSISPKKNYYIIRIWLKDNQYASSENYNISIPKFSTLMYKKH